MDSLVNQPQIQSCKAPWACHMTRTFFHIFEPQNKLETWRTSQTLQWRTLNPAPKKASASWGALSLFASTKCPALASGIESLRPCGRPMSQEENGNRGKPPEFWISMDFIKQKKKNIRNIIGMIILAHRLNMFESTNENRFSQQVPRSGRSRTQIAAPHFTIFVLPPYPFVLLQICAFGFKVEAHYIFKVSLLGGYNYA